MTVTPTSSAAFEVLQLTVTCSETDAKGGSSSDPSDITTDSMAATGLLSCTPFGYGWLSDPNVLSGAATVPGAMASTKE
jgi:hypothetical protein